MPIARRKRPSASQSKAAIKSLKKPNTRIDFSLDDLDVENKKGDAGGDDVIESEDDFEDEESSKQESSENEKETADAKKIRMAREYLNKMEQIDEDSSDVPSSSDDEDDDASMNHDDLISKRLERHRLKQQGMYERIVASKVQQSVEGRWTTIDPDISNSDDAKSQSAAWADRGHIKLLRGHDLTTTCVALHSPSGSVGYSGSKDNSILMWDIEHEKRISTIIPRWNPNTCDYTRNSGEVLAMAASDDGRYLAVGGRDSTVKIFDVRQKQATARATVGISDGKEIRGIVTTFEGHKGPVTALAFRSQSLQLFSGSNDRCIRHYNLNEMAYVETLYGHQAAVTGISCHGIRHEMPYSVARDRTARAWKLAEETHMIYRGGSKISNADCISAIKDDYFLTGHEDGVLSLWIKDKKRPIVSIPSAHGFHSTLPRGIVSCASLGGSDFAATGSSDGFLRLWKVSTGERSSDRGLDSIGKIPLFGYINDLAIGPKGRFCIAAVGQEPRLGRWDRIPLSKNRFAIVQLRNDDDQQQMDASAEEKLQSDENNDD
mmetsp:Transcript_17567/g.33314  ORF Transcript_17567/g.33314 Transcript_17567/m.33314 type:complete len:547 (-) Transcript_17567:3108-4748(-)